MAQRFFITGTDTGVGKTVASALLCAALEAIYWKPIQTGTRDGTDRGVVRKLAQLPRSRTVAETYRFAPPVSPHLAARRAGVRIDLSRIQMPALAPKENLMVEGAGGVLAPINETQLMVDLMSHLKLPVLLVARTSLGTINHTLLSLAALRRASLEIRGVILTGKNNAENRKAIEHYGQAPVVGSIAPIKRLNRRALLRVFHKHFEKRIFAASL